MAKYWLMKSEPDVFSIDQLKKDKKSLWDGVRNYQARNFMRDMQLEDRVLFYHSNANPPGIAGVAKIVKESYPDFTAWDKNNKHYDPKSSPEEPRWVLVDVKFERQLKRPIPLTELKQHPALDDFQLNKRGNRLSIFPVSKQHWDLILSLE